MHYQADDLIACLIIGAAAAAIAISFTQGTVFDSLRKWIGTRNALLGQLAGCFFCLSHWIVFAGIAIYRPRPLQANLVADLVVAAFFSITAAIVAAGLMFAAFLGAMHSHVLRERLMPSRPQPTESS